VPAQPGALGHLFAGEPYKHPSGVQLRTGDANQRHGEILCAALIAHNVNNFHQAAGALTVPAPWAQRSPPSPLQCPASLLASPLMRLNLSDYQHPFQGTKFASPARPLSCFGRVPEVLEARKSP
jgi:hypothetical protein